MSTPTSARLAAAREPAPSSVSKRLIETILWVVFAASGGAVVVGLAFEDRAATLASLACFGATPLLLWLARRGQEVLASVSTILMLIAVVSYAVANGAGIHDNGMLIFPVVVVVSSLLLDRRLAATMSTISIASALAIGAAELSGWLKTTASALVSIDDLLNVGLFLGTMTLVAHSLTKALHAGLEREASAERSYRQIFNATREAIFVCDADTGAILDANQSAFTLLGLPERSQLSLELIVEQNTEFSKERALVHIQNAKSEGPQNFEWSWNSKSGKRVWVDVNLSLAWIGEKQRIIAVMRDITGRRALEEQSREGEKLKAVGQLAGGIAHDFNNQLTAILSSAELLERAIVGQPDLGPHVEMIHRCASRSAGLTRQLLAFARRGKQQNITVDCNALIAEVITLLKRSVDKRITLKHIQSSVPALTEGDPSLLENAILNLALNARDAMPSGGVLSFRTSIEHGDHSPHSGSVPNITLDWVKISVSDTGMGMDAETVSRVFEPFFTTKEWGNGMGLAAAYGTAKSHGGSIAVSSALGAGSTFDLLLPRARPMAEVVVLPSKRSVSSMDLSGLRVLVADDEPAVARVVHRTLQQFGCKVTLCSDGAGAISRLDSGGPDAFDLVILDHGMPGLTGTEVMHEVRKRGWTLPVVIMSGYTGEMEPLGLHEAQAFLAKPFTQDALAGVLKQVCPVRAVSSLN